MNNFKVPRIKFTINKKKYLQAIYKTLYTGEFVTGKALNHFATLLCKYTKKNFCILTSNGFSALFLAIKSLGWTNKKIAIPVASTCFSTLNAIIATGNIPIFIDNDLETGNICFKNLEINVQEKKVFRAILPSHFGILNDILKLKTLNISIIEDNAQAVLSSFCFPLNADVVCFSFYPTKFLNSIDGGAILTDFKYIADEANDIVYYAHQYNNDGKVRYNFRMNNLNAALGIVSLNSINTTIKILNKIKKNYFSVIKLFPFVKVLGESTNYVFSRFVLRFPDKKTTIFFQKRMIKKGIEVSKEFIFLDRRNLSSYPNAKKLIENTISIPFRDSLKEKEINYVKDCLFEVLTEISHSLIL